MHESWWTAPHSRRTNRTAVRVAIAIFSPETAIEFSTDGLVMSQTHMVWQLLENRSIAKVGCEISVTPLLCSSWHVKVSGVQVIQRRLAWQFVKDDTHKSNVPVAHTSGSKTRSEIGAVSAQL